MKKLILCVALLSASFTVSSFKSIKIETIRVKGEVCFKIKNDTGNNVTLHTGKGTAPMPSGSTKEFCMEEGKSLHYAEKGMKGKSILTVSSYHSGKVIKLSSLKF
ncbi:MAG: hypothetical protein EAZ85_06525 [Bacteroidetes bacterium]|nr:MAG: hypothetical protein EAZ85_06525 [Bacteroidota bacterium]TAG90486.1 MAG: hypothetical protein EAZ20_04205 [Bacteroidota bacterium]